MSEIGHREVLIGGALAVFLGVVSLTVLAVVSWPAQREPPGERSGRPTVTVTYTVPRGAPAQVVLPGTWCATPGERAVTIDGSAVVCATGGTARATHWVPAAPR